MPRPGSDGQVLAESKYGVTDPGRPWSDREAAALRTVTGHRTTTRGVHDRYAHLWLDHHDDCVAKLSGMACVRTIGHVAGELFPCAAE